MKRKFESGDNESLLAGEQARLDAWLEAARSADVPSAEEAHLDASPDRRAEHVRTLAATIEVAAKQKQKRRALLPWYGFAAAACFALVATAAGLGGFESDDQQDAAPTAVQSGASLRQVVGTVIAVHPNGENQIVGADTVVSPGDEISTTAEGFASLEADKARVDLSSATTVQLEQLEAESQTFHLHVGRVDVSVPKVPGTKRQVKVRTPDALVSVHGTVFSVEVAKRDGKEVTSVGVTRGLVSVDHGGRRIMLPAGSQWNSIDGRLGEKPETAPAPKVEEPKVEKHRAVRRTTPPKIMQSDLAEQNRLFERAVQHRDSGNDELAIKGLRQLLAKHPTSPLRTTAQAELRAALRRSRQASKN